MIRLTAGAPDFPRARRVGHHGWMHPDRLRTPRTAAATAAALLSALLLSACGASDPETAEPASEPAPGVSVPADLLIDGQSPSTGASPEASAAPSDDPSASPEPSPSDEAASEDPAAACADLQTAWAATNRALVGLSPEHPRSLVASFREAHKAITSVEPPSDIEPAWSEMTDYLTSAVDALRDVDADDATAVTTAVTEALDADDTARATAAGEEVTAYVADSCSAS